MVIAGLQVLVVGALLGVIYFTLLKPDDDGSLFGVEAPQDAPQVTQKPERAGDGRGRADRRRPPRDALPGERLIGFGGAPPTGAAPGLAPVETTDEVDDSPGGDQYGNTLARLDAMLDGDR